MAAENLNLKEILIRDRNLSLLQKATAFSEFLHKNTQLDRNFYFRVIDSPAANRVMAEDVMTGKTREMYMFGSNNYLGLANHPYVREKVNRVCKKYGTGLGGPPSLNGYTSLHRALEERLSAFKKKEDTLLFSSGYSANIGLVNGMTDRRDLCLYDDFSHASFYDGLKGNKCKAISFEHNNIDQLEAALEKHHSYVNTFVSVEGVYSMDGDMAPLDQVCDVAKRHNAMVVLDDAHGTGLVGKNGRGTAEHFGVEEDVDIVLGTFSKVFALNGAFVSSEKPIIDYLRYFARSYMFSASLPPVAIAAIDAVMDLIEDEPQRRNTLFENVQYTVNALKDYVTFACTPDAAIIAIRVPARINIRQLAYEFHCKGIFINSIEYPAVSVHQQRFRISMMATHTKEDINYLVDVIKHIWDRYDIN